MGCDFNWQREMSALCWPDVGLASYAQQLILDKCQVISSYQTIFPPGGLLSRLLAFLLLLLLDLQEHTRPLRFGSFTLLRSFRVDRQLSAFVEDPLRLCLGRRGLHLHGLLRHVHEALQAHHLIKQECQVSKLIPNIHRLIQGGPSGEIEGLG